jgi:predicted amidohydrolase
VERSDAVAGFEFPDVGADGVDVTCYVVARVGIVVGYEVWNFPEYLLVFVVYELKVHRLQFDGRVIHTSPWDYFH